MIHGNNNGFSGFAVDDPFHTDLLAYDGHFFLLLKRKRAADFFDFCSPPEKKRKAAETL